MGNLTKSYMVLYNVAQVLGWSYVFCLFVPHFGTLLKNGAGSDDLYNDISFILRIIQVGAYVEVLHNVFGCVKTSPTLTAAQITSRVFLVFICDNFEVSNIFGAVGPM